MRIYLAMVLIWMVLIMPLSAAGQGTDPDVLISQDRGIAEQNYPSVAAGLNGRFAVIWADYRTGNGDIYCRLFDSGAVAVTDEFRLNDDGGSSWQFDPDLSSDWYGQYYAVWKDYRNGVYPFDPDVFYQRLDSAGLIGTNKNVTVEHPDSSHQSPAIASAGWGKSVVAWTDLRNCNWDLFIQPLTANGDFIGGNLQVNADNSSAPQHEPDIALSPEGWYVVTWYDSRDGNEDIYLQKFDSAGAAIGVNIKVNDDGGTTKQKFPTVAIAGNGTTYLVWTDWRNGIYPNNSDVYLQRFDKDLNRLGANIRVNRDSGASPQRDPAVAADRMGNACIVWSDSAAGTWDLRAQMIDYTGDFVDTSFFVHTENARHQLQGDVAIDGYHAYVVWVDNRNGNFDIYGKVIRYNDPTLITQPDRLAWTQDKSDPEPDPFIFAINNAGYGEIVYRLRTSANWISLSKNGGVIPDSFTVTLHTDSLAYGIHQAYIELIDETHGDSGAFLPIVVTITGPQLHLNPDSLWFRALTGLGPPATQNVQVTNTGTGILSWTAATTAPWILLDKSNGSADETISVGCDLAGLVSGQHQGLIIFSDPGALNSPESMAVILDLESNLPYLAAEKESIQFSLLQGETVTDSMRIINLGWGTSHWTATNAAAWLVLETSAGSDNDYLRYVLSAASLGPGQYFDTIRIIDPAAFNNPLSIPAELSVLAADTVYIAPASAFSGGWFQTQISLWAKHDFCSASFQWQYDTSMIKVDSLIVHESDIASRIGLFPYPDSGRFAVEIFADSTFSVINGGEYLLCDLFGMAKDSIQGITRIIPAADTALRLEGPAGERYDVSPWGGEVEVSMPTGITEPPIEILPGSIVLEQNYPNPFNGSTLIRYSVKESGPISLVVYNILGQVVTTLVDVYSLPGDYWVDWEGRAQNGAEVASGIYFCRLSVPGTAIVKKIIYAR